MANLTILNSKETKEFKQLLLQEFGIKKDLPYIFLRNEKSKIYITNTDLKKVDITKVVMNTIGLYIGQLRDRKFRLSIEGSQILGPLASKNILEITQPELKQWLAGEKITTTDAYEDGCFVIIKYAKDYIGSGKHINGTILNYVSKARRLVTQAPS